MPISYFFAEDKHTLRPRKQLLHYTLLLGLSAASLKAQDSLDIQSSTFMKNVRKNLEFDITGGNYYQTAVQGEILLPKEIRDWRRRFSYTFNPRWNTVQDNPLYHGAFYVAANAKYKLVPGVTLFATLIGEHRGASYGVTNTDNMIVFPQMNLRLDKRFTFLGEEFRAYGSIGNQVNPRLYEGLTVYNMYQQGTDVHLAWKKFSLNYLQISDLVAGLGLNINDTYDSYCAFEGLKLNNEENSWLADVRFGYSYYPSTLTIGKNMDKNIYNISGGFYKNSSFRLYGQASLRPFTGPNSTVINAEEKNWAGVVGVSWKKKNKRHKIDLVAEARYYGSGFNRRFIEVNVRYREPVFSFLNHRNTIGDNLYPLMLLERPFSQWAVFTEYQGLNVGAITCQLNHSYTLHKHFVLRSELDLNFIQSEGNPGFLYPFYTVGLGWESGQNSAYLSASNKGMNLDVHYPTFYLYKIPCLMFSLKRTLSEDWFDWKR